MPGGINNTSSRPRALVIEPGRAETKHLSRGGHDAFHHDVEVYRLRDSRARPGRSSIPQRASPTRPANVSERDR
jgi:hypothetical protein